MGIGVAHFRRRNASRPEMAADEGGRRRITGISEHAVLAECERDEDTAKHAYEAALKQEWT